MSGKHSIHLLKELVKKHGQQRHMDAIVALESELEWVRGEGWVSVKERLPPQQGGVFLATSGEDIAICGYWPRMEQGWFVLENDNRFNTTHWRPLPPPIKEAGHGQPTNP